MTDTNPKVVLDAIGPGPEYRNVSIWLPQLFLETRQAGLADIEGRTFTDCLIEGPAVLLPSSGCRFDACDMGNAHGDARNLMLKPLGPQRVTGTIPVVKCQFIRCRFLGVGFTGPQAFLDAVLADLKGSVK